MNAIWSVLILLSVAAWGVGCRASVPASQPLAVVPSKAPDPASPPARPRITHAIVGLPTPPPATPHSVQTEDEAVALADVLLVFINADWGRPSSVQKTESGGYRVEYGKDARGVARVVLVNAETGRASFPLPR